MLLARMGESFEIALKQLSPSDFLPVLFCLFITSSFGATTSYPVPKDVDYFAKSNYKCLKDFNMQKCTDYNCILNL